MGRTPIIAHHPKFDALSPPHRKFVLAYLKHFNETQAYIDAGYNVSTRQIANVNGSRLLASAKVAAAVKEMLCVVGVTPDRLKCWLAELAAGNDIADFQGLFEGETLTDLRAKGIKTRLIKKIKATRRVVKDGNSFVPLEDVSIELYDRQAALETLAKTMAMLTERIQHEGITATVEMTPQEMLAALKKANGIDDTPKPA